MSISSKITASSALFVLLLAGVLLYHRSVVKSLVTVNQGFSDVSFHAATLALTIVPVVDELADAARKYRVTRDDEIYGGPLLELEGELTALLDDLQDIELKPPDDRPVALLAQGWLAVRASSAYRLVRSDVAQRAGAEQEPGAVAEGPVPADAAEGDVVEAAGGAAGEIVGDPMSEDGTTIAEPVPEVEIYDLAVETALPTFDGLLTPSESRCDLGEDVHPIDIELCRQFEHLRQHAEAVLAATRRSIGHQVERSNAKSQEAERVSRNVVAAALVMTLVVGLLTARSIKRPLRRFTAGTRAVADGKFFYQLDERSGDEFADSAAAFNSMAQRLGELDRLKREFLAHVSHELKTPIVTMQETNALLLEQLVGPLNDKQQRIVRLNLEGAKRLSSMISNLLDLSRMEAGALEYDFQETDLVELVELVREELAVRMQEKGLWLEADLSPRPLVIYGDRDRLIQVIENLYENAVKFSAIASTLSLELSTVEAPPDHLPIYWRRRMVRRGIGRAALLTVSDSGPGVPDDHKEKIFEKFYQVEKSQKKGLRSGVGLGLSISREIVEAHRGALWVEDNTGIGSTFFLMLPIDPRRSSSAA